jgi:saccharopine dehydrogenase-like NADP-dependent oxidoreductase
VKRALVIGWRGGVGMSLLHLLEHHPAASSVTSRLAALYLADVEAGPTPHVPPGCRVLEPDATADPAALARTLRDHRIDQVIEVADVNTRVTSAVCAAAGADYLSASLVGDGPTMTDARELLVRRPDTRGTSHLIGAGMNPGIVNALVLAGVEDLARRSRRSPTELDLYAIHVTEQDTTAATEPGDQDVFEMSWSPRHALDELLEPRATYVATGAIAELAHRPCDALYAARCGDREIAGLVVPHEELIAIGARFRDVETAFVYAIPERAAAALRRYPHRRPAQWMTRRLYAPHVRRLTGHDRVGVVLASRRYGELWLGYQHPAAVRGAGNGTLLQIAAGVLAGWALLGSRTGIHTVDDLDVHAYLASVETVLGPRALAYVHAAIPRTLAERRLTPASVIRRSGT